MKEGLEKCNVLIERARILIKVKKDSNPKSNKPRVRFYSGSKSFETPRSITIGKKELAIKKITEQKRITDIKLGKRYDLFVCETDDRTYSVKVFDSGKTYRVSVYEEKEKHTDE